MATQVVSHKAFQAHATSLKTSVQQNQSDGYVIQMYLTAVLAQPDIVQDFVPSLPDTQKKARNNAEFWSSDVWPTMTQTVSDLLGYGNQWTSYSDQMKGYAQIIASTTSTEQQKEQARLNLDGMLGQLYDSIEKKQQNAVSAYDAVSKFTTDLSGINKEFDSQLSALQNALGGEKGAIAALDAKIEDLNSAIARDATIIAVSSLTTLAGIGLIVYGAVAEFETAGMSTALIASGIGLTGASVGALAATAADLGGKITSIGKLVSEKEKDEQMYTGVKTALNQVAQLEVKSTAAVSSAKDLQGLWGDLKNDIGTLRADIQNIKPGDFSVVHAIDYADSDWDACIQAAQRIQTATAGGEIPRKTGKDGTYPDSGN